MGARRGGANKYGAIATEFDGTVYPSKAEAAYAMRLAALGRKGEVAVWTRMAPRIVLVDAPTAADRVTYRPDFDVRYADGSREFIEVKGKETTDWRIRLKLYRAFGPPIPLRVVYGDGREVIVTSRRTDAA